MGGFSSPHITYYNRECTLKRLQMVSPIVAKQFDDIYGPCWGLHGSPEEDAKGTDAEEKCWVIYFHRET